MTGNEKLHGGAQRLSARVINDETVSSQRISWYEIAPGDQCTRHVHEGKFETWLVIQGTGVSHVGEQKFEVGPGDMIATPPGTPHGLVNTGETPLRFVNVVLLYDGQAVTTTELDQ